MTKSAVLTRLTHAVDKKSSSPEPLPPCLNCGQPYAPKKKGQKYCSDYCRIKNWHFKTAGQKAIADLQKENAAILARLSLVEAWMADEEKRLDKRFRLCAVKIPGRAIL